MSRFIKTILGLGLLALAFGLGHQVGSQKSYSLMKGLNNARTELNHQIEALEQKLRRARLHMNLMNAKTHLLSARTASQEGRYKDAGKDLAQARKEILKVAKTANSREQEELKVLADALKDVKKQLNRSSPMAQSGVQEIMRALEKFLS